MIRNCILTSASSLCIFKVKLEFTSKVTWIYLKGNFTVKVKCKSKLCSRLYLFMVFINDSFHPWLMNLFKFYKTLIKRLFYRNINISIPYQRIIELHNAEYQTNIFILTNSIDLSFEIKWLYMNPSFLIIIISCHLTFLSWKSYYIFNYQVLKIIENYLRNVITL